MPNGPDKPSIIPIRIGSDAATAPAPTKPDNNAQTLKTLREISKFKAPENKITAPNSTARLPHGAATNPIVGATPCSFCLSPALSRDSFRRIADDSFDHFFSNAVAATSSRAPALDVSETESTYTVSFDVPGVSREQLNVSVEGRRVSIETVDAMKPVEAAADAPRGLYRERGTARYARTVSLPAEVDQATSRAKLENDVLTRTLAKKVARGATQLSIS